MLSVNRAWPCLQLLPLLAAAVAAESIWGQSQQSQYPPDPLQAVPTALDMVLLQQVTDDIAENEAISPFVMSSLMMQVFLGTGGTTRDEMKPVLGLEDPETGVALDYLGGYRSAIDYLSSNSSNATVAVFNRMYVQQGFSMKSSFNDTLRDVYGSVARPILSPSETATEINSAVSNITRGKIEDLVSANQLQNVDLVLVSALYFKALWKHPFSPAREEIFLTAEGERQVEMMSQKYSQTLLYANLKTFEAVALPYADPDYSLLLLRPPERSMTSVRALLGILGTLNIADIVERMYEKSMYLSMPKFTIEAEYSLPEHLQALGIREIFSSGANFSGLTDHDSGVFVSDVIHKVCIEVTEEGTEAAGAGAVLFTRSMPMHFILDRPFVAVVYNKRHNLNLFSAYVASPASGSTPGFDTSSQRHDRPRKPTSPLHIPRRQTGIISERNRIHRLIYSRHFGWRD